MNQHNLNDVFNVVVPIDQVLAKCEHDYPKNTLIQIKEEFPFLLELGYVAGGFCEYIARPFPVSDRFFDVDVFFPSKEVFLEVKQKLNGAIAPVDGRYSKWSEYYTLYFDNNSSDSLSSLPVQHCLLNLVTFDYFETRAACVSHFDISCCQISVDMENFYFYNTSLGDLQFQQASCLLLDKKKFNKHRHNWDAAMRRMGKYMARGYIFPIEQLIEVSKLAFQETGEDFTNYFGVKIQSLV